MVLECVKINNQVVEFVLWHSSEPSVISNDFEFSDSNRNTGIVVKKFTEAIMSGHFLVMWLQQKYLLSKHNTQNYCSPLFPQHTKELSGSHCGALLCGQSCLLSRWKENPKNIIQKYLLGKMGLLAS